jgi:hypothetical protein
MLISRLVGELSRPEMSGISNLIGDIIMRHVNFELARIAKVIIDNHLKGTRHRLIIGPLPWDEHIEDSGESYDTTDDCVIEHMLDHIVPGPQGYKRLQQVLQDALLVVAAEHTVDPAKIVDRFLTSLRGRSLRDFLCQPDDNARKRQERRVRVGLAKLGFALRRSKKRNPLLSSYGLYHVIHVPSNSIIVNVACDLNGIEKWMGDVRDGKPAYDNLPFAAG